MKKLFIFTALAFFCLNASAQTEVNYDLPLEVNYDKSFKKSVEDGDFDFVGKGIDSLKFSTPYKKGEEKIIVRLFSFEKTLTSKEVIDTISKMGYTVANWPEGLAFGQKYRLLQLQKRIVILGSIDNNKILFLYKTHENGKDYHENKKPLRALWITSWYNQWKPEEKSTQENGYYFLAVKIEN
jgi:hypothetical protein